MNFRDARYFVVAKKASCHARGGRPTVATPDPPNPDRKRQIVAPSVSQGSKLVKRREEHREGTTPSARSGPPSALRMTVTLVKVLQLTHFTEILCIQPRARGVKAAIPPRAERRLGIDVHAFRNGHWPPSVALQRAPRGEIQIRVIHIRLGGKACW